MDPASFSPVLDDDHNYIIENNAILVQNNSTNECCFLNLTEEIEKAFNIGVTEEAREEDTASVGSEEISSSDKMWTDDNTLFLIQTVGQHDEEFSSSVKKNVWVKVAKICQTLNCNITPQACESKWKALKRTYKSVNIHNNTTGKNKRHWKFYNVMHEIMYKKPEINPVATCSGSSGLHTSKVENDVCENAGSSKDDASEGKESSFMKKRKQKIHEAERRHMEKMRRLDKFNDLFQQMVNKM